MKAVDAADNLLEGLLEWAGLGCTGVICSYTFFYAFHLAA